MSFSFKLNNLTFHRSFGALNSNIRQSNKVLNSFQLFKNLYFFCLKYSEYLYNASILIQLGSKYSDSGLLLKTCIVRFYLKGIGYKFLRSYKFSNFLKIELGHSVSTYVRIPMSVKIFHKRDKLIIVGFEKLQLINFSKQIFHLRPADVYKGKGIRLSTVAYTKFKPGKQR